jgi:uncharacterized glyoxalase superfamily protein PhnB
MRKPARCHRALNARRTTMSPAPTASGCGACGEPQLRRRHGASVNCMPTPRIDGVALVASELSRTVIFYRALGCELPDPSGTDGHLEAQLGSVRLMIDTEEMMKSFDPDWSGSGSGRMTLAAQCASPAEVDRLHAELSQLGSGSHLAPFDAFWGQRYATVLDPDGVRVDLYAPLPSSDESS